MRRRYSSRYIPALSCMFVVGAAGYAFGAGAPAPGAYTYHETQVLGTSLDLQVTAAAQADADRAHTAVMAEVERLRKILSTYDAGTDLGKVNASKDAVKVSKEVIEVLKLYDQWLGATKGTFSGRLGTLIASWKDAAKAGKMPDKAAIAALVAAEKNPLWKLDEAAGTVQRLTDQTINIDSLGKGFIVSRAAAVGKASAGVKGLLLNIGGDITTTGTSSRTGIEDWVIGIADPAHPADNAAPLATVKLTGLSIATSGSYERSYAVGSTKLSHILDPRNGYPIDSADAPGGKHNPLVAAATVIAADNPTANALATSLCVLSPEEGLALIAVTPGTEALIVGADGKQYRSAGFKRYETVTAVAGEGWPNGAQVSLTLSQNTTIRKRPYVAIWIENAKGEMVTTLAMWGNNVKYLNSLPNWYKLESKDPNLKTITKATRPAGKYTLVWDGKDAAGKAVAPGTYKVCVETSVENGGHAFSSGTIECGDKNATVTLAKTQHFDDVPVMFAPKAN